MGPSHPLARAWHAGLGLEDVAASAEVHVLLVLALGDLLALVLGERAAQSAGLLLTEVKGLELLALVELTEVGALLLVHHSEHTGNVLADRVDAGDLARRATGNLLDTELKELELELLELGLQLLLGLVLEVMSADLDLRLVSVLSRHGPCPLTTHHGERSSTVAEGDARSAEVSLQGFT
mgnify:CR=1 FL=1